jgi:hypothetical protein
MTFSRKVSLQELWNRRKRSINNRIVMIGYSGVVHRRNELARDLSISPAEFYNVLAEVCADHYRRTQADHWFERGRECSLKAYGLREYSDEG